MTAKTPQPTLLFRIFRHHPGNVVVNGHAEEQGNIKGRQSAEKARVVPNATKRHDDIRNKVTTQHIRKCILFQDIQEQNTDKIR